MAKKKETPLNYNPNWNVAYEYKHGKDTLTPGTEIRFKYNRGIYKFEKYVIHTTKNIDWIDAIGPEGYRSFPTESLKGIVKPKIRRPRKKRDV